MKTSKTASESGANQALAILYVTQYDRLVRVREAVANLPDRVLDLQGCYARGRALEVAISEVLLVIEMAMAELPKHVGEPRTLPK